MYRSLLVITLFVGFVSAAKMIEYDLPRFEDEPADVAELLDWILVGWTGHLSTMIRTREGRATLRSYFNHAIEKLMHCLSNHDHTYLRILLRTLWNRRAQRYYDFETFNSYLPHLFTESERSNGLHLYTYSSVDYWSDVNSKNWSVRSPPVPRELLNRLLIVHTLAFPDNGLNDIYRRYEKYGINYAEYFFETCIETFYRLMFYFIELKAAGIDTNKEDTYAGYLQHHILPANIHMIILSDYGYGSYLLRRRFEILRDYNGEQNEIVQNLANRGRVVEENLIWLMMNPPSTSDAFSTTQLTTTLKTTTLGSTTPGTPDSGQPPFRGKKDDVVKSSKTGKFFKRRSTFPEACCESGQGSSSNDDMFKSTKSCFFHQYHYLAMDSSDIAIVLCNLLRRPAWEQRMIKKPDDYFGYMTDDIDFNAIQFLDEEPIFIQGLPPSVFDSLDVHHIRRLADDAYLELFG